MLLARSRYHSSALLKYWKLVSVGISYVLIIVKHFLAERSHVSVIKRVSEVFPKLFRFKECGVLFIDSANQGLFKIQLLSQEKRDSAKLDTDEQLINQGKDYENVIYFPKDIGCTGLAI